MQNLFSENISMLTRINKAKFLHSILLLIELQFENLTYCWTQNVNVSPKVQILCQLPKPNGEVRI